MKIVRVALRSLLLVLVVLAGGWWALLKFYRPEVRQGPVRSYTFPRDTARYREDHKDLPPPRPEHRVYLEYDTLTRKSRQVPGPDNDVPPLLFYLCR